LFLGIGLLIVTVVGGLLEGLGTRHITFLGQPHSLDRLSTVLLYLLGFFGEAALVTAIYLVMPVGQLRVRHAVIGGVIAALMWEVTRRILAWYLVTMSQIQVVYGSLTTAIAVLLSVEFGALVLLLGAQVIAEYERVGREPIDVPPQPLQTETPWSSIGVLPGRKVRESLSHARGGQRSGIFGYARFVTVCSPNFVKLQWEKDGLYPMRKIVLSTLTACLIGGSFVVTLKAIDHYAERKHTAKRVQVDPPINGLDLSVLLAEKRRALRMPIDL
jgi:hypothetical protein